MDRSVLQGWLAEGLSLEAMGERAGRHPSTMGYWLKKHGLQAVHRDTHLARGPLGRDALEQLVAEGLTVRSIAARTDRSYATVRHWLREYGLRTKSTRGPGRARPAASEPGGRLELECARHGLEVHVRRPEGGMRCLRCRSEAVTAHRRKVKAILIDEAGGRCARCGYSGPPAALHFHHLDPAAKTFHLGLRGASRSLDEARRETQKCLLLCANCHAEVEGGLTKVPACPPKDRHGRG